jgi:cytochrome P450
VTVVDYSPIDPAVLTDPAPAYAELRARCPVHRGDVDGRELYTLARRDDVAAALRDHETWSNLQGPGLHRDVGTPGDMQHDDPPEHDRRREFARRWFVPPAVAALEAPLRALAASLATELAGRVAEHGQADLYADYALPLPVTSFCALMGLEIADKERFVHWADELTEGMTYPDRAVQARRELRAFTAAEVARRRALAASGEPLPAGLLSHLATSPYDGGEPMPAAEVVEMVNQLLVAGHETTTSLITNCVWRLLEDRDQRWERVVAESRLVLHAVEESLRFDPPVLGLCRTNNRPVTLHGVSIPADAKVMMLYASANRDATAFDRPDEFVVDRPISESMHHLSFSWGVHHCLGAHLARLTGRVAVGTLVERVPALRLAGEPTRVPAPFLWGRKTLPVTL